MSQSRVFGGIVASLHEVALDPARWLNASVLLVDPTGGPQKGAACVPGRHYSIQIAIEVAVETAPGK